MSHLLEYYYRVSIYDDMYSGVPAYVYKIGLFMSHSKIVLNPKSQILMTPSFIKIFYGLRSLCTILNSCNDLYPCTIWLIISNA